MVFKMLILANILLFEVPNSSHWYGVKLQNLLSFMSSVFKTCFGIFFYMMNQKYFDGIRFGDDKMCFNCIILFLTEGSCP